MSAATYSIPRIETDRLILRAPSADDLPAMIRFYETERSHIVGGPRDATETWQSLVSRLGHWALKGFGLWHLTERSNDAFVGWAGMIEAPAWDEPELGWTLMPEAEGRGLAYEAASAARYYAARHQGLNCVISYIAHANARSRILAGRLGAKYEREGAVLGKSCQVWRHPSVGVL